MNENVWFLRNQKLLLGMAKTDYGKQLLCIEDIGLPIVSIRKNEVRYLADVKNDSATFVSDFRVGAKWGSVIRHRWGQFNSYARYFQYGQDYSVPMSNATKLALSMSASTLTTYPEPHAETSTFDGFVIASGTNHTNVVNATTANEGQGDTETTIYSTNHASLPTYYIYRSEFLFDTSSLTSSASISDAVLSLYSQYVNNPNSNSLRIVTSNPASNTAVTNTDYGNFGSTGQASDKTFASITVGAYNDFTFDSTGKGNVSKTGISKFGMRNTRDIGYQAPPDNNNDGLGMSAADFTGTSQDPKLVVTYTISTISAAAFLLLGV